MGLFEESRFEGTLKWGLYTRGRRHERMTQRGPHEKEWQRNRGTEGSGKRSASKFSLQWTLFLLPTSPFQKPIPMSLPRDGTCFPHIHTWTDDRRLWERVRRVFTEQDPTPCEPQPGTQALNDWACASLSRNSDAQFQPLRTLERPPSARLAFVFYVFITLLSIA